MPPTSARTRCVSCCGLCCWCCVVFLFLFVFSSRCVACVGNETFQPKGLLVLSCSTLLLSAHRLRFAGDSFFTCPLQQHVPFFSTFLLSYPALCYMYLEVSFLLLYVFSFFSVLFCSWLKTAHPWCEHDFDRYAKGRHPFYSLSISLFFAHEHMSLLCPPCFLCSVYPDLSLCCVVFCVVCACDSVLRRVRRWTLVFLFCTLPISLLYVVFLHTSLSLCCVDVLRASLVCCFRVIFCFFFLLVCVSLSWMGTLQQQRAIVLAISRGCGCGLLLPLNEQQEAPRRFLFLCLI